MECKKHNWDVINLLLTIFLDSLGVGIAMPLFTPLILNSNYLATTSKTTLVLSVIFALYPLGMFIGSPLIGYMADKYGKKLVLLNCILGNTIGTLFCFWGILNANLLLICMGRIISGLTAGNVPVAQSAIISLSNTEILKTSRLGYISMVYGLGFTAGPPAWQPYSEYSFLKPMITR